MRVLQVEQSKLGVTRHRLVFNFSVGEVKLEQGME